MSNSIADILKKRGKSDEPHEFAIIKDYMASQYQLTPKLSLSNNSIIISVPNAGVAGSLRLSLHELQQACQTKRRLIIRIGQ
jgi:hypothetical protein